MSQEPRRAEGGAGPAGTVWWIALAAVVIGHVMARDLAELGRSTDAALALLGADFSVVGLACVAALLVARRRAGARRGRPIRIEQLPHLCLSGSDADATASTLSVPSSEG